MSCVGEKDLGGALQQYNQGDKLKSPGFWSLEVGSSKLSYKLQQMLNLWSFNYWFKAFQIFLFNWLFTSNWSAIPTDLNKNRLVLMFSSSLSFLFSFSYRCLIIHSNGFTRKPTWHTGENNYCSKNKFLLSNAFYILFIH